jgi:hypothetical protein
MSNDTDVPVKLKVEMSPARHRDDSITLVQTISYYRRQQTASAGKTPIKMNNHKYEETDKNQTRRTKMARKAREVCENKI